MTRLLIAALLAGGSLLPAPTPARAQPYPRGGPQIPGPYGFIVGGTNNTGGAGNLIMPRGGTGADTVFTNSAVGSNAQRPELAVPNGSAGGGGSSR